MCYVAGHGGSGQHGPKLGAFFAVFVRLGERLVAGIEVGVDLFPALGDHALIVGDKVPAGGTGIAVAMVVEPHGSLARAALPEHHTVILFGFALVQAGGGLYIEPRTGKQVTGQEFVGQVVDHHLLDEPGLAFGQAPGPKVRGQIYGLGRLLETGAKSREKGIGLGHDVEGQLLVLKVPGGAGGPRGPLVVPSSIEALEVVVAQPLDTRR